MLGDLAHKALTSVGVTPERVTAWLGRPCRCRERQAKLNALHAWAIRVMQGKTDRAREHLDGIMGEEKSKESS